MKNTDLRIMDPSGKTVYYEIKGLASIDIDKWMILNLLKVL